MVLCYNKELLELGKNLENAHFWKELRKMFYFEIEKFENKNFKRCFSLVLYII